MSSPQYPYAAPATPAPAYAVTPTAAADAWTIRIQGGPELFTELDSLAAVNGVTVDEIIRAALGLISVAYRARADKQVLAIAAADGTIASVIELPAHTKRSASTPMRSRGQKNEPPHGVVLPPGVSLPTAPSARQSVSG